MRLGVLGAILFVAPLSLAAQERVRFSGTMRDSLGKPVGDVAMRLVPGNRNARSSADGRFGFDSLVPGQYDYEIRRLGFNPVSGRIAIQRDTVIEFRLVARPRMLDTVVVTGECSGLRFSGFLCRRAKGQGIFFTEEDILDKNPEYLADVLAGVKDVAVFPVMTRYGQSRRVAPTGEHCVTELLDGRVPVTDRMVSPTGTRSGMDRLDDRTQARRGWRTTGRSFHDYYKPEHLIGVEVYPPGTPIPDEYKMRVSWTGTSRKCMLVNYWTGYSLPKEKKKD